MRKALLIVAALLALLSGSVFAQTDKLVNISYDPRSDSLFFRQMQQRMAEIRKEENRPTVALVLAGGGAKGAAHIGVLKYLEEKGIPIDFVAGTSMGGLMGGFYALGYSAADIDSIVRSIDWNTMMSDNIPMGYYTYTRKMYKSTYVIDIPFTKLEFLKSLPSGVLYGLNVYNMMSSLSVGYQQNMSFMDLPTPYCCVATEIVTQKEKHWTSGNLIDAMRSTMSIPGYFRPVRVDSMILSDGGTKNNFPTDVAVAAGADIIIGVEMTMPRDYKKVNNVADILMQTAQYSGGLEAHNRNVGNATVYITPDISGFGMLSFGTEEINTLIWRGYEEASKHAREIDSIVQLVGNGGRELHHPKAINTDETKVKVTDIQYEGVTYDEERYIDGKIRLDLNEYYDKHEFELSQAIIFGTMAFTQVTYRLESDGADGYRLIFRCEKRPPNSIGVGLRLDSEEWFAAQINVGLGRNKIFGSLFDITARLSMSPYLGVNWYYLPKKGPKFGASFKTLYRTMIGAEDHEYDIQYMERLWRNELKIYIADTRWSQVSMSAGVRIEQMPYYRRVQPSVDSTVSYWNWRNIDPYVYFRFTYDHENTHYFPDRGLRVYANYDYDFHRTHFAALGIHGVIPCCKFFAILASANGRYIFGKNENPFMDNYAGGTMAGRYYEQQIPFIGYNSASLRDELLTSIDLEFRFKIGRKIYLSAIGAALHDGYSIPGLQANKPVYAAGLQFGYNSRFGPLMANLHWNSRFHRVGFYFSMGYDF